jgi:hypothetical protein
VIALVIVAAVAIASTVSTVVVVVRDAVPRKPFDPTYNSRRPDARSGHLSR